MRANDPSEDYRNQTPPEYFGEAVFGDQVMRTRLSRSTYESLKRTIDVGEPIDSEIADEVAAVMKQWAVEKGATHYTHWFMPLNNTTAEKHDSFIEITSKGQIIMNFSGRALTQGEPDASSFPTGGLRETSRARGYTAWDCTSPAFIKERTLYIPTAFYSYGGEILDRKAPLLRSVSALSQQGMRIVRLFGNTSAQRLVSTIGPEQEYFLIDEKHYMQRPDFRMTGRTLFGAPSPKDQELDDHYFGIIKPRVLAFMQDLDTELWRQGISAKTRHNEVAPSQHELAVIFNRSSEAADNNMLVMEFMRKIASRHGLVCLLHEKPFAGVNGSGKHINWSLATDNGVNLLDPTENPYGNPQFLVFFAAVIQAVDEYADLLRASVASASNDHRLGAHEAPPAIISIAIGEELEAMVEAMLSNKPFNAIELTQTNLGIDTISLVTVDKTDRNRTSPFAFTGNKFEFRMCGSNTNIAEACYTLNTAVAMTLSKAADYLEGRTDIEEAARAYFTETIRAHRRIIFSGDNYSDEWITEAGRRGLSNMNNTVDAVKKMLTEKNIRLFADMNVLTPLETESRADITLETYYKNIMVEAHTAIDMTTRAIMPAIVEYIYDLTQITYQQRALNRLKGGVHSILDEFNENIDKLYTCVAELKEAAAAVDIGKTAQQRAEICHDSVIPAMQRLRHVVDAIEPIMPKKLWPYPSYMELMFGV